MVLNSRSSAGGPQIFAPNVRYAASNLGIFGAGTGINIGASGTGIGIFASGSNISASSNNTGSGTPAASLPPYYALCFIEYTGIGA